MMSYDHEEKTGSGDTGDSPSRNYKSENQAEQAKRH